LRVLHLPVALMASIVWASVAFAQAAGDGRTPTQPACPPDADGPTVGRGDRPENPSDKLAQSQGVICPPAGIDPQMQVKPPAGGELKVIPAPGTPGGNPNVQPK
jgi:hypothetical protein